MLHFYRFCPAFKLSVNLVHGNLSVYKTPNNPIVTEYHHTAPLTYQQIGIFAGSMVIVGFGMWYFYGRKSVVSLRWMLALFSSITYLTNRSSHGWCPFISQHACNYFAMHVFISCRFVEHHQIHPRRLAKRRSWRTRRAIQNVDDLIVNYYQHIPVERMKKFVHPPKLCFNQHTITF